MLVVSCPFCRSDSIYLMMDDVYKCPACFTFVKIWEFDLDKLCDLECEMLFGEKGEKKPRPEVLELGTDRAKGGA